MSLHDSLRIGADSRIGVLGGYGAVGRSTVRQLVAWGAGTVLVAGRRRDLAAALVDEIGDHADATAVDVADRRALEGFCARCDIVVNCAGPSCVIGDQVARVAQAAGVHYVDAGGDDRLHQSLTRAPAPQPGDALTSAVLSAGMLPGLTGLLPRILAQGFDHTVSLVGYAGGLDEFTVTAATDYCDSLGNGFGRSYAEWRNGRREALLVAPPSEVELPFFPAPAIVHPYLSTEMERLARRLGLEELRFFNVFPGANLRGALRRDPQSPDALVAASVLDVFGRDPYQRLVFQMDGHRGSQIRSRTLVMSARGASELTGTMAALATSAVARAAIPPGVHFAAEVLDPAESAASLGTALAMVGFDILDDVVLQDLAEEGAL